MAKKKKTGKYDSLKSIIDTTKTIGVMSLAAGVVFGGIKEAFLHDKVIGVLACLLLVINLGRYWQYILVVYNELDILNNVFTDEQIKKFYGGQSIWTIALLLTFSMMAMMLASPYLLAYTAFAVAFSTSDIFGQLVILNNIGKLSNDKSHAKRASEEYRDAVFSYYFDSPLMIRLVAIFVSSCASAGLAIGGYFTRIPYYDYAAYINIIVTTVVGEVFIYSWRKKMREKLEALPDPEEDEESDD